MSVTNDVELGRIALLEAIQHQGKEWDVLAPRYGVTNPSSVKNSESLERAGWLGVLK